MEKVRERSVKTRKPLWCGCWIFGGGGYERGNIVDPARV